MTRGGFLPALCRAALVVALTGLAGTAHARVAPITLKELVDRANVIVVARVAQVEDGPVETDEDGRAYAIKVATADVLEVWKGTPVKTVRFRASRSWACDTSRAVVGEQVLLFLVARKGTPIWEVAHSGRGRMSYRDVRGTSYVTLWDDVELPLDTPMIPGPEPQYSFIRSVKANMLKRLVTRAVPALRASSLLTLLVLGLLVLGLERRTRR